MYSFAQLKSIALKSFFLTCFYRFIPVSFLLLIPFLSLGSPIVYSTVSFSKIDTNKTSQLWLAAQVLPGSGQIINKQYWKVPVVYAGMGSMIYFASETNKLYLQKKRDYQESLPLGDAAITQKLEKQYYQYRQTRNLLYATAGVVYLASVADALLVYNKDKHSPATATILSTLIPGLGQIYNEKYWKVPVVYGGLSTFYFMVDWNNRGYQRFKKALLYQTDAESNNTHSEFEELRNGTWVELRSDDEVRFIKNSYRRNRDLSALGFTLVYILNIIDANVDANLYDWNVSDDLSLKVEPTINTVNFGDINSGEPVLGLSCKITF